MDKRSKIYIGSLANEIGEIASINKARKEIESIGRRRRICTKAYDDMMEHLDRRLNEVRYKYDIDDTLWEVLVNSTTDDEIVDEEVMDGKSDERM